MKFIETKLPGAYVIEAEPFEDARGFFARSWSVHEFEAAGLNGRMVESNISFNRRKGTLRGMHFQRPPRAQAKLVRCTLGSLYDVMIDLRPDSPTFKQWFGAVLSAANHRMLYVPEGFAHGFQTLEDNVEAFYQVTDVYAPELSGGVRWDDPAFGVEWPDNHGEPRIMVPRDAQYPDFEG